eukprot:TRINITY_DN33759_c0_g1_i1.p1 TRINITY_DN33759_c0_g1~~TRINITY_DN33759_c0_g1_i1.p1  ORF type:complete len:420 (+),score=84.05 TRINITY_DN33759_c0_g1_i1:145-1404(+)
MPPSSIVSSGTARRPPQALPPLDGLPPLEVSRAGHAAPTPPSTRRPPGHEPAPVSGRRLRGADGGQDPLPSLSPTRNPGGTGTNPSGGASGRAASPPRQSLTNATSLASAPPASALAASANGFATRRRAPHVAGPGAKLAPLEVCSASPTTEGATVQTSSGGGSGGGGAVPRLRPLEAKPTVEDGLRPSCPWASGAEGGVAAHQAAGPPHPPNHRGGRHAGALPSLDNAYYVNRAHASNDLAVEDVTVNDLSDDMAELGEAAIGNEDPPLAEHKNLEDFGVYDIDEVELVDGAYEDPNFQGSGGDAGCTGTLGSGGRPATRSEVEKIFRMSWQEAHVRGASPTAAAAEALRRCRTNTSMDLEASPVTPSLQQALSDQIVGDQAPSFAGSPNGNARAPCLNGSHRLLEEQGSKLPSDISA